MKLIVGLGNPGKTYRHHRHNIGFLALDHIAQKHHIKIKKRKFTTRYAIIKRKREDVVLIKPQTYMNLSGTALENFVTYFNVSIMDDVLVIVDDVNLPFGKLRIRTHGSAGGHNGLQSIIDVMGTDRFTRLRVGIDAPPEDIELKSYVLSRFSQEEEEKLTNLLRQIEHACFCWLTESITTVMQQFN